MSQQTTANTAKPTADASNSDGNPDGRRMGDRRTAQRAFEGPDRRTGDRRSGKDRRGKPRLKNGAKQSH